MLFLRRLVLTVIACFIVCGDAAYAENPQPDRNAIEVVMLFEKGCLPYVGNPAGLRSWAKAVRMELAPSSFARAILSGGAKGVVFNASSTAGRRALVSLSKGDCEVAASARNQPAIQNLLVASLLRLGAVVKPVGYMKHPDTPKGIVFLQLYHVDYKIHHWAITVITNPPWNSPSTGPEIQLWAVNLKSNHKVQ